MWFGRKEETKSQPEQTDIAWARSEMAKHNICPDHNKKSEVTPLSDRAIIIFEDSFPLISMFHSCPDCRRLALVRLEEKKREDNERLVRARKILGFEE